MSITRTHAARTVASEAAAAAGATAVAGALAAPRPRFRPAAAARNDMVLYAVAERGEWA